MKISTQGNDDQIHHSEGKNPVGSCRVSKKTFSEESDAPPPNLLSQSISEAPPGTMPLQSLQMFEGTKHQCIVKRLFKRFFGWKEFFIILTINGNLTIQETNSKHKIYTINNMINNGTVNYSNCTFYTNETNNHSNNNPQYDKADAEAVAFEEVKPEPKREDTSVTRQGEAKRDYSKSALIPLMTHPEHAEYNIERFHLNMDNQTTDRERIKPLYVASENKVFKSTIPYEIYKQEFGGKVSQPQFSRLMGKEGNYSEDELKATMECLKLRLS